MSFLRRWIFLLLVLAVPGPALAHAILLEASPAAGARVAPGRTVVELRFNSRIDVVRSRVSIVRPGGASEILAIVPGVTEDRLGVAVDLAPGAQVVRWQVLAVDGHITRGELRFTVRER